MQRRYDPGVDAVRKNILRQQRRDVFIEPLKIGEPASEYDAFGIEQVDH